MPETFTDKYKLVGEQKFYKFLLAYALNILMLMNTGTYNGISPELEFLEYSEKFMTLYRRNGDEIYLDIAKLFRKAAHKMYRLLLKKNLTSKNAKFLNLV